MKFLTIVFCLLMACASDTFSQNTQTSGNWSDPSIWSGGSVPAVSGTVSVNNPVTIDGNLSPTGSWAFNSNATDQPGGTAYTFNPNAGTNTININAGSVITFEGGTSGTPNQFSGGTINIYGTLILGYTQINNSGNLNITVQPGGTLIINGDLINKNNTGTFTINGALIVNGNFTNQTGSITVGGSGTINTTGSLTSNGGSTIFGTTNDCTTGPCSGGTLNCSFTNTISPVSKAICSGSSAGTLTSTTTATSPTYQWLSSIDNVTYGNAAGTSTNSTYVTPSLTQTTWYKLKVTSTSGPCTSTSAEVKITVLGGGGWLGATSNDWGTAGNWCTNSVPSGTTDVTITNASGVANMPTINAGTVASCRNLTISNTYPASSVTIASGGTASLSIYGDFTNNGTFTDNSTAATAGVKLAGSVVQNLKGTTPIVINNLTINNVSGVFPAVNITSNNLAVNSNLTMTSGVTNLGGYTITLGTSTASPGTLAYSSGTWFYGGNIVRWFPASAVTMGSNASFFPIGDASNYRPMYFGSSGLTSSGGTVKVSHTSVSGSSSVSFLDAGMTVQVRSNSYWTVSAGNGISSTGTPFSLRTEGTGFGVVGTVSDLRLTLAGSAAPGVAGINAGTITNPQVNRTLFSVTNLSNNFYWGSINPLITPLPIVLKTFSGRQESGQIKLSWTTATEQNFNFFSLEKSVDGVNYGEISRIRGTGRDNYGDDYAYADEKPSIGRNYYRLKQVDLNGSPTYSKIVLVYFSEENSFILYPNPSDGKSINARINSSTGEAYSIEIFDNQGKTVGRSHSTRPEVTLQFTPVLPAGIYFARFSTSASSTVKCFLVKK